MAKPIILVSSRSFSTGKLDLISLLESSGCEVRRISTDHSVESIARDLAVATGWIAGVGKITSEILDLAPNLKIISRYGVGVDSIDLTATKAHGILVTNTPGANSNAVAELAISLIFAALRNLLQANLNVRKADWNSQIGREMKDLRVGVIGFGKIGQLVGTKLEALGALVSVYDPFLKNVNSRELDFLNTNCEVITLHAPGLEKIITRSWIDQALQGQIIINTARAALVDEQAVADGLKSGKLSFYAADSLQIENTGEISTLLSEEYSSKTLFTPHIGAQTSDSIDLMGAMAVENILAFLSGNNLKNLVSSESR